MCMRPLAVPMGNVVVHEVSQPTVNQKVSEPRDAVHISFIAN